MLNYLTWLVILFSVTTFVIIGVEQGEYAYKNNISIDKQTDYLFSSEVNISQNFSQQFMTSDNPVERVVYKGAEFMLVASFETASAAMQFGYNHPNFDYNAVTDITKIVILSLMAAILTKPIIYFLIFVYYVIDILKRAITKRRKDGL